ncbi:hypothetical protein [Tersicoccus sp. Bi-70]|uniref:hypothetical protein n=1 Tax=Tersicoccus sp. Bi-70 TaxID=1897634 RepID=UPI000977CF0A|nr:hypothetical protein [Tersicoccus sp. Bi-70]OMH30669.1 hypothetical protein BGP79_11970 [Tersicoccus sp. Bi-70]
MITIHATAERDGKWWFLRAAGQYEAYTQVRHLKDAAGMVADAVATLYDLDASDLEVTVTPHLSEDLEAAVRDVVAAQAAAQEAARRAAQAQAAAAAALLNSGLPMRDAAEVLGVSHQRVGQIVKS